MGTRGKINAIWWNIKINLHELVDICGYELPTNLQNFTQKDLNEVKYIPKSFGGLLFSETPCRAIVAMEGEQETVLKLSMVQFSMTLNDPYPRFQGHAIISNGTR